MEELTPTFLLPKHSKPVEPEQSVLIINLHCWFVAWAYQIELAVGTSHKVMLSIAHSYIKVINKFSYTSYCLSICTKSGQ
jgi:hypothetical protein